VVVIVGRTEVIMPTVKQLGISIASAMAIVGAGAFCISAIDYGAAQVPTDRFTPSRLISGSMIISGSERRFWAKKVLSCPEITADAPQLQS
jgi:hypothetical protein